MCFLSNSIHCCAKLSFSPPTYAILGIRLQVELKCVNIIIVIKKIN